MDAHGGFDLETHERYRQLAARMAQTRCSCKPKLTHAQPTSKPRPANRSANDRRRPADICSSVHCRPTMDEQRAESKKTCAGSSQATSAATTSSCSSTPATPASTRSGRWASCGRARWPTSSPASHTPPRTTCRSTPAAPAPAWPASRLGRGLVLDFSRYMRRILAADADTVRVQPGVVLDALNALLAAAGPAVRPRPGHEQRHHDGQRRRDRRRRQPLAASTARPAGTCRACRSCWPTARCWKSAASRSTQRPQRRSRLAQATAGRPPGRRCSSRSAELIRDHQPQEPGQPLRLSTWPTC